MILGIDASNIRGGGGVTHLVELLTLAEPRGAGFEKVIVWGAKSTLSQLPERDWLEPVRVDLLERSLFARAYWQRRVLPKAAAEACDLLFVPGGAFGRRSIPVVTMSQNLLPFESREIMRYGLSWVLVRILILRYAQGRSFKKADGVIFLTEYARAAVTKVIGGSCGKQAIIPHGINRRFYSSPREQRPLAEYSTDHPFRLLYVSIVDMYKHQWTVVEAVARLRNAGVPVELDLVGPAYAPARRKLEKALDAFDQTGAFLHYHGPVPYQQLHEFTARADAFIFASTCENLPIILLEGMASGVPIACSSYGPMREVLHDAGVYFDPESADSLYQALHTLLDDERLRKSLANLAHERALEFSWQRCANATFEFLASVASGRDCSRRADND